MYIYIYIYMYSPRSSLLRRGWFVCEGFASSIYARIQAIKHDGKSSATLLQCLSVWCLGVLTYQQNSRHGNVWSQYNDNKKKKNNNNNDINNIDNDKNSDIYHNDNNNDNINDNNTDNNDNNVFILATSRMEWQYDRFCTERWVFAANILVPLYIIDIYIYIYI